MHNFNKLFFRYKSKFFFRADDVASYISSHCKIDISPTQLINELVKADLLPYSKEGKRPHLPNKLRNDTGDNRRYSRLNLEVLMDLVSERYIDCADCFNSPIKELNPLKN